MKLDQTTQFAFKEAVKETPDLSTTLAIVPLSAGVGVIVLIGALLVCWGLGEPARHALVVGGLAMSSCAIVAFWRLWADRIYMSVETIIGQDLDGDGYIGAPPPPQSVTIEVVNADTGNLQYLQVPGELYEKLPLVAHLLTAGKPFSEGAMTGSGRPLSRSEFHFLRDVFFDRGIAAWRDPEHTTQGVTFTPYGRSVIRQFAELRTTPPRMRTQGAVLTLPPGGGGGGGGGWDGPS